MKEKAEIVFYFFYKIKNTIFAFVKKKKYNTIFAFLYIISAPFLFTALFWFPFFLLHFFFSEVSSVKLGPPVIPMFSFPLSHVSAFLLVHLHEKIHQSYRENKYCGHNEDWNGPPRREGPGVSEHDTVWTGLP